MSLCIYLTGRVALAGSGTAVLGSERFPGRQGRRAFAFLVCERARAVPREELAEAIWQNTVPPAWDAALSALVSKLRRLLAEGDPAHEATIASEGGCYVLRLPP